MRQTSRPPKKGQAACLTQVVRLNLFSCPPPPPCFDCGGIVAAAWQVTTAVQYLVEDGRLNLHGPSRAGLPGFYDPAPGQDKALYVLYRFKVRAHARECVRGVGGWRESERDRESERLIM